ncbi:MAG: GlxA family transcriptional regulator, partial [Spongiibacter sp.]
HINDIPDSDAIMFSTRPADKAIGLLAFNNALATSISLPMELFNAVNHQFMHQRQGPVATLQVIALDPPPISMSGALTVHTDIMLDGNPDTLPQLDILVIPSRWRHPLRGGAMRPQVKEWLRALDQSGCEICAVGNGSYFLAEAGLLDHRAATTHWHYFDDFQRRYPSIKLKRDHLITQADNLFCTGSVNSAADLIIHLIDRHWGAIVAQGATRQFSPESRRPFSRHAYRSDQQDLHSDEVIALAQSWMHRHIGDSISIADLAEKSGLSQRSFLRRFRQASGQTPLQYLQMLRLENARDLLQNSNLSLDDISQLCGYADTSYLCKLFRQRYTLTPGEYRRSVRRKLFAIDGTDS